MRTWVVVIAMLCFSTGTAFGDVSNEVVVGIEVDSSKEVKSTLGGVETDLTDQYETANSFFTVQYSHFFEPLRDDDTPVDLRGFLQHPSTLSAGIAAIGMTTKDRTNPASVEEDTITASMLLIGGEHYFPTFTDLYTGLFLNLGAGSGTFESKVNGVTQPDADVNVGMYELGIRQYVAPNVALHLAFTGDAMELQQGGNRYTQKSAVTRIGVHGVIKNVVGLTFEIGGGERTDTETGFVDNNYDVGTLHLAGAVYVGKELSFGLDLDALAVKQTGLPAGLEYTESTARVTLSAAYWFSERFGLQVPIYSETSETKIVVGPLETKLTETNSGLGIYAGFRF